MTTDLDHVAFSEQYSFMSFIKSAKIIYRKVRWDYLDLALTVAFPSLYPTRSSVSEISI